MKPEETIPAALKAVGKVTAKCVFVANPANQYHPAQREFAETILAIIRTCEPLEKPGDIVGGGVTREHALQEVPPEI